MLETYKDSEIEQMYNGETIIEEDESKIVKILNYISILYNNKSYIIFKIDDKFNLKLNKNSVIGFDDELKEAYLPVKVYNKHFI